MCALSQNVKTMKLLLKMVVANNAHHQKFQTKTERVVNLVRTIKSLLLMVNVKHVQKVKFHLQEGESVS